MSPTPLFFVESMPRVEAVLSDEDKAAFSVFCRNQGITEAELLRRMIRQVVGHKPGEPEQSKEPEREGSQNFTLRLDASEIRAVEQRAQAEGFDFRTTWATAVIRNALAGAPALTAEDARALRESNRELAAIGRNLNQIARAINIEPENAQHLDMQLIETLGDIISAHRDTVSVFLDRAQNRFGGTKS